MSDQSYSRRAAVLLLALVSSSFLTGCSSIPFLAQIKPVPSYQPSNVYHEDATLPPEIKRVAILPLSVGTSSSDLEFGRETLGPILEGELGRSRQFETVLMTPDQLKHITGTSRWVPGAALSEDFFEKIARELGVQAVLLPELTQYRPHEPLAVGWRLKLVDAAEPRILWAIDEVFDARDPGVAAAARRHAQSHPDAAGSLADDRAILQSPRRFARYAACAVVETLPTRGPTAQKDLKK